MAEEDKLKILVQFGKRLKALKKASKLSYRKLSNKCDLDYANIKRLENCIENPTLFTIDELTKAYEVPAVSLFDFSEITVSSEEIKEAALRRAHAVEDKAKKAIVKKKSTSNKRDRGTSKLGNK